jgi:tetratricopeptide (TPR) repeat protein
MRKRIILIVVIALIVGAVGGGIWWYVRRNTGTKLLARAELAIRASQYDRALDLANDYLRQYPDDWQGHYVRGRAFMLLGRFADARQPLQRVTELNPSHAAGWTLHADTYALPARKALSDQRTLDQPTDLRKAIEDLQQASRIVALAKTATGKDAVDLQEYVGLNHMHAARARGSLASRLEKEAKLAQAAGSLSAQSAKQQDANAEFAASDKAFQEARDVLTDVVRKDASRDAAAGELVSMCIQRGDTAALETARKIIFAVDEANRPPIATSTLTVWELRSAAAGTGQGAWKSKLEQAAKVLDQLLTRHPNRDEVLMARADVALMQSDANTAADLCQRILKTNPRHGTARLCEARVLVLRGKLPEAETKLFELVTDLRRWDMAQLAYGQVLASLGKTEPARKAMLEAVSINPANAAARSTLVEWSLRDGRYRDAYDHAKILYEARPADIQALLLLAQAARDANEPELAKAALSDTRRKYPNQPELLVAVAEGYARLGDAEQSRRVAEQAADIPAKTEEGRLARARAMQMANRLTEAEALLESLVAEQPQSARAQFGLAQSKWQNRRRMDAIENYRKAAALEDRNVIYRMQLAQALLDVGLLEESLQECRRVLDLDPGNASALLLISQAKVIRGEDFGADPRLAQTGPAGAGGLFLAQTSLLYGQVDKCIEICQAELTKSPNDQKLRELLATAYLQVGRKDQGLEQWKALLKAEPEQSRFYQQIASIWLQDMPLPEVEEALGRLPEARKYMVDLAVGEVLFRARNYEAAAEACRRAASREGAPDDVRGRARLQAAMALALAGRPEPALGELDALSAVKGWHTPAMLNKARLLHAARRSGEAKAVLDGLRKGVDPARDPLGLAPIAEAYAVIDCLQDSLAVCDTISGSLPNDARPCLLRAEILTRAGQPKQAQDWYRKAIERSPGDLSTYAMLARSLESSLDIPGALDVLRKMASVGRAGQVASLTGQAALYARQGLYQPAIRCLEDVAAQGYAEDPQVRLELGQAFAGLARPQQAAAILKTVPRYSSQYVRSQRLLADLAETDDARLAVLLRLAEAKPDLPDVLAQQMAILIRSGRGQGAVDLFGKFASGKPSGQPLPGDAAHLAVQALCESGKRREAADLCSRMAKDTRLQLWRRLAGLLLADHDAAAARSFLPDPNAAGPFDALLGVVVWRGDAPAARVWQAKVEPRSGLPPQATVPPLHKILSILAVGDAARAEEMLAKTEPGTLPPRAAAAQLVAFAKSDPNASLLACDLLKALLATDLGLRSVGRGWAMDVLKVRPDSELAVAVALGTQPDEPALKAVSEQTQPNSLAALEVRAELLVRQKKFAEAADTYGQLARARKDEPEVVLRQGTALEMAGKYEQALALYQEVLKARKDPPAANNAAYLLGQIFPGDASRLKEALSLADQAVAAQPTTPAFRDTKGWVAYLLGQHESARQELRQAVTGIPGSAEVHYHLGLAEAKGGSLEMARLHLEAAVALSMGLPAAQAAALPPSALRAGELAQEALKTLEPPKP